MHLCSLSIKYACPYQKPTATMGHLIHDIDISKSLTHKTPYTLSAICPAIRHRMFSFAHSSRLRRQTAVTSRPRWGRWACRWASLWWFLTVCAEFFWLCKPIVAAAIRVASLRRSWRWRCWMWRSWADVVKCGLRFWGRLGTTKFSETPLETAYGREINIQVATSLWHSCSQHANFTLPQICDICGIVLCDKTAHFRVAFYCGQPKAHLCNNHAV